MLVLSSGLLHLFTSPSGLLMGSTLQQLERYKICKYVRKKDILQKCLRLWGCLYIMYIPACVCIHRMTVYSRCGIPPRAGVLQWWSRIFLIKSLLLLTSPLFTWPILARSLVCPGGRPASSCPSKKGHIQSHNHGGK